MNDYKQDLEKLNDQQVRRLFTHLIDRMEEQGNLHRERYAESVGSDMSQHNYSAALFTQVNYIKARIALSAVDEPINSMITDQSDDPRISYRV